MEKKTDIPHSPLREIKVPPAQIWREFRMRFLPVAVFVAGLAVSVFLWNKTIIGPTLLGEVETIQTAVTAPSAGFVTNLLVRPFQLVKKGEVVAEIVSTDARQISSQVQDLRGRIALSQLEINSRMDHQRLAFDYQALSMNTLRFRADLAAARAELPTLQASLKRAEQGWKEQVIPYNDYELALRTRDSVSARVAELEKLVAEAEARLQQAASSAGAFTNFSSDASLPEAIRRLSQRREADDSRNTSVVLYAPIDGSVGTILRRPGENVLAGDTIMTIHALEGERIMTYVRPGSSVIPKRGMPINVRCRTQMREQALARVEEVGHRYEPITNMALIRPGAAFELGMPISISMPASLRSILRPGETVDLDLTAE